MGFLHGRGGLTKATQRTGTRDCGVRRIVGFCHIGPVTCGGVSRGQLSGPYSVLPPGQGWRRATLGTRQAGHSWGALLWAACGEPSSGWLLGWQGGFPGAMVWLGLGRARLVGTWAQKRPHPPRRASPCMALPPWSPDLLGCLTEHLLFTRHAPQADVLAAEALTAVGS